MDINKIIIVFLILLALVIVFFALKPCKKEGFFYWRTTPLYASGTFSLQSAIFMAQLSNLAYYAGTPNQNIIQSFMNSKGLKFNPADNIFTYLNTDTAFIWATDTQNKSLYISFRGTVLNEDNLKTDLYQTLVPFQPTSNLNVSVSYGFNQAWLGIRSDVFKLISSIQPDNIFLTGHSLGAALATLCAFDMKYHEHQIIYNTVIYTFGSPRVGDIAFATNYNKMVSGSNRVQNIYDPVPRFPTEYQGYLHVNDEVLIDKNMCEINAPAPTNYVADILQHPISVYISLIQGLMSSNTQCIKSLKFPRTMSHCTGGNTIPPYGYNVCLY